MRDLAGYAALEGRSIASPRSRDARPRAGRQRVGLPREIDDVDAAARPARAARASSAAGSAASSRRRPAAAGSQTRARRARARRGSGSARAASGRRECACSARSSPRPGRCRRSSTWTTAWSWPDDARGFQGVPGAFSEDAARAVLAWPATIRPRAVSLRRFEDVFDAVRDGTLDSASSQSRTRSPGPCRRPTTCCANAACDHRRARAPDRALPDRPSRGQLDDIRHVLSHPVALAQCRRFFAAHPGLRSLVAADTAGAVAGHERPPGEGRSDREPPQRRAVRRGGPPDSSRTIRRTSRGSSWSRREGPPSARRDAPHKTSLVLTLAHRPGALVAALEHFARHSVDLTMIESRPARPALRVRVLDRPRRPDR